MSLTTVVKEQTFIKTCAILEKPLVSNLKRLAAKRHTSVSFLLNVAAEEYLRRYIESQKEPITIQ